MDKKELKLLTLFLPDNSITAQRLWHVTNGDFNIQTCKICNLPVKWNQTDKKYRLYCSSKCSANDSEVKLKKTKAIMEKYGSKYYFTSEDYKQKAEQTNLRKYGTKYAAGSDIVQHKIISTNQEKYGVNSTLEVDAIKNKISLTMLSKYGTTNAMHNSEIAAKTSKATKLAYENNLSKIIEKRWNTNFKKYGRADPAQKHISSENIELSYNKEWLITQNKNYPICYIAKKLGMGTSQLALRFKSLGIEPNRHNISSCHQIIVDYIKTIYSDKILINDRKILNGLELDIILPNLKLAIEINGLYWHSEISGKKDKNYHLNKMILANNAKYQLIQIWDYEINNSYNQVTTNISNIIYNIQQVITNKDSIIVKDLRWGQIFSEYNNIMRLPDIAPKCWYTNYNTLYEVDNHYPDRIWDCGQAVWLT